MARFGNYKNQYEFAEATFENDHNVVLDRVNMPDDGWITGIGIHAGGYEMNTPAEIVLYSGKGAGANAESRDLLHRSGQQVWNSVVQQRYSEFDTEGFPGNPIRRPKGAELYYGFWGHPNYRRQFAVIPDKRFHHRTTNTVNHVPAFVDTFSVESSSLGAWIDYIPNDIPLRGRWKNTSPSGVIGNFQPRFEGTIEHPESEMGLDRTDTVHIRIYDKILERFVYNKRFTPTSEEHNQGYFSRKFIDFTHQAGHDYFAEFRHQDTWGVWSNRGSFGDRTHYTTGTGPERGTPTSPLADSKINTLNPTFSGTYSHPNGIASGRVRFEVWNGNSKIRLWESGWTLMSGTSFVRTSSGTSYPKGIHEWAKPYTWRFQLEDINGTPGPWTPFIPYRTNTAPYAPTNLTPSGGRTDGRGILNMRLRDRDGDFIQNVRIDIKDKATGNSLLGYPVTLNGPFANGSVITYNASADLVFTKTYQWEAWASDSVLTGEHSEVAEFRYDSVPNVTMVSPTNRFLTNRVIDPSAEYAGAWKLNGVTGEMSVVRTDDGGAHDGHWYHLATRTASTTPGGSIGTPTFDIDTTRPMYVIAELKKFSGIADTTVRVRCLDVNGVAIGSVIPTQVNGGLNAADPADYWRFYGGYARVNQWPVGTTQGYIEVIPSNTGIAVVGVDRAFGIVIENGADTTDALDWLGYFDGDTVGYGNTDDYIWNNITGNSSSQGLPRLTDPSAAVTITYSSTTNVAKKDDRLIIEKLIAGSFTQIHDSQWVASNRTVIPVQGGVVKNQGRYRVQAQARDMNNVIGTTGWIVFDVEYEGPPTLNVEQIGQDPSNATLDITWQPSDIDPLTFVRYDVAVESTDEGELVVEQISNQDAYTHTYHAPVSNRTYKYKVRAVELVGTTEVEGKWAGGEVSVDYYPYYFIKDLDDPNLMIQFEPLRGQIPGSSVNDPLDEYLPLDSIKPIHIAGQARYETGSMEITLFDDERAGTQGYDYRAVLFEMAQNPKRHRKAIILSHLPGRKNFTAIKGLEFSTNEFLEPVVSLEWSDTMYVEDKILREGN